MNKTPGVIYEFPVWQHDTFIKSQEVESDISSENYKIMLSKAYEERIALEKKTGISLVHHANLNTLDSTGTILGEKKRYSGLIPGVKPAFLQKGYENYGQPDGNVDFPLTDKGASVVPTDILAWQTSAMIGKIMNKDIPILTKTFQSSPKRDEVIEKRVSRAKDELKYVKFADYTVMNDNFAEATRSLKAIIINLKITPYNFC